MADTTVVSHVSSKRLLVYRSAARGLDGVELQSTRSFASARALAAADPELG